MLFDVIGARWRNLDAIVAATPGKSLRTQFTKMVPSPGSLRAASNPFTDSMPAQTRRQFIRSTAMLVCGLGPAAARANDSFLDTPVVKDTADRLLVPAYVNGHGPYRFLLDTGASHCSLAPKVAARLKLPPARSANVSVNSTTGRSVASAVAAQSLEIGSLRLEQLTMPVIAASDSPGVVGANALTDKRLTVNFDAARLEIAPSPDRSTADTTAVSVRQRFGGLLLTEGKVDSFECKFIVDTGAQRSMGNPALARRLKVAATRATDPLIVKTPDAVIPASMLSPMPIKIGSEISIDLSIACAELPVFALWELAEEPAVLLGMDYFSQLSSFAIDYRHSTLAVRQERR